MAGRFASVKGRSKLRGSLCRGEGNYTRSSASFHPKWLDPATVPS